MPSVTTMPQRSFAGEIVRGEPLHTPNMIFVLPAALGALSPRADEQDFCAAALREALISSDEFHVMT
jgi:hypothetical protein